jgi:hypothetical protein
MLDRLLGKEVLELGSIKILVEAISHNLFLLADFRARLTDWVKQHEFLPQESQGQCLRPHRGGSVVNWSIGAGGGEEGSTNADFRANPLAGGRQRG